MSDRVLIPFGDRFLALDRDAFDAALAAGEAAVPPRAVVVATRGSECDPLLSAGELAAKLGVAVSQVREQARRGSIPVVRVGRHHRFDLARVRAALDQTVTDPLAAEKGVLDQRHRHPGFTEGSALSGPHGRRKGAGNGR